MSATDGRQRRILNGLAASGGGGVVVPNGSTVTLHTLDDSAAQNGGPYTDEITLVLQNSDDTNAHVVTVKIGATTIGLFTVPKDTAALVVLDGQPLKKTGVGETIITASVGDNTQKVMAWGWFIRG